ncbi:hypothetical protein ACFRH6_24430 [Streptomyces sp. NPDC056749]|uniref:hypothetical protein n=1 Tax=Streptomyces sp. NPDC056749 TaxID=3345936 RepID=UPI0036D09D05
MLRVLVEELGTQPSGLAGVPAGFECVEEVGDRGEDASAGRVRVDGKRPGVRLRCQERGAAGRSGCGGDAMTRGQLMVMIRGPGR